MAYHEIGHALVAAKQTNSAPVQKITIVPRTSGALGYTMQVEERQSLSDDKGRDLENKIATSYRWTGCGRNCVWFESRQELPMILNRQPSLQGR